MATVKGSTAEKVFSISSWKGLHESPDGDTQLAMGEASVMRNWRITRDGNLQRRPGYRTVKNVLNGTTEKPVKGLWSGYVNGHEQFIAACDGKLWKLWDDANDEYINTVIGNIDCTNEVHMFGFSGIVYFMNGTEYKSWDGTTLSNVEGYRPLVTISVPADGGGDTLEGINKLNGKRRSWFSPDGVKTVFHLPEQGVASIDWVKNLGANTTYILTTDYTVDTENGTVTFLTAPAQSTNGIEIAWSMSTDFSASVKAMRYSELFSGEQDTRIFIYGDGSNKAFYSGIDYDGKPRADYFPDLNEMAVGDSNTPITSLIRHYSRMICFKSTSTYSVTYGTITLTDSSTTEAFYTVPVNRSIGNAALGQARLVLNSPRTVFGNDIYEWKNNSSYSSNLTVDERQAKRISDRVYYTMSKFKASDCYCWDDNDNQEWYVCYGSNAIVNNYASDSWYYYTDLDIKVMCNFHGELYFGDSKGNVAKLDIAYNSDDGEAIDAYWESGSMSFGQDYVRKYSAMLWLGIRPSSNGEVEITVQTDKASSTTVRAVTSQLASFTDSNFGAWSFETNQKPHISRLKIKAKKFVFYKLILKNNNANTDATVLASDIRVRFTGYAK